MHCIVGYSNLYNVHTAYFGKVYQVIWALHTSTKFAYSAGLHFIMQKQYLWWYAIPNIAIGCFKITV